MIPDKYKNITFQGSTFPDDPYQIVKVKLNDTIKNEYIPAMPPMTKGMKWLLISMTHMEGFRPGTRSYRYNNPGNLGNTDSGANKGFKTLADGIAAQAKFIQDIIAGKKSAYPMGKTIVLKPYYSPEIANNPQYGLPPYLPGYKFKFTGQLDQFVKIYSTGARVTNNYIDVIVSLFKQNSLNITPTSTLTEIVNMDDSAATDLGRAVGEAGL